jgi:uncharacterized protein with NRDE domain
MCLILLAFRQRPDYPLILAANRDEFFDRPAAPLHYWKDSPEILAGRDLKRGGTWLGVNTRGRFAVVSNYRDPTLTQKNGLSRGQLVSGHLKRNTQVEEYLSEIHRERHRYDPFNLLLGDPAGCWHYASTTGDGRRLGPGIYGLSNAVLDTPWPKVIKGKHALAKRLAMPGPIEPEGLFELLGDTSIPSDDALPNTGVGLARERTLAPIFITGDRYGTRSSTVVLVDDLNRVTMAERSFDQGACSRSTLEFHFTIERALIA